LDSSIHDDDIGPDYSRSPPHAACTDLIAATLFANLHPKSDREVIIDGGCIEYRAYVYTARDA